MPPEGRLLLVLIWLLLAACEPEATPYPVDLPTPSPPPATTAPIRYALASDTAGTVADMTLLEQAAQVTVLDEAVNPADLGERFDLIAAYGTYPDATPSPVSVNYTLLVNNGLPPLDEIADHLLQSIDPAVIATTLAIPGIQPFPAENTVSPAALRAELANAGWPDGIDLLLIHDPGIGSDALTAYFAHIGIRLNPAPWQDTFDRVDLALVTWTTTDERQKWLDWAGPQSQAIDLFTLPISYWAIPDLTITYSPQGWPVPAWP